MKRIILATLLLMAAITNLEAKITLPSIISDNMVLQQKASVKIWGWTDPSTTITITTSWSNKHYTTLSGPDGKWSIYIKTPGHSRDEKIKILSGDNKKDEVEISNILIGEVWLASGQSNMEFEMKPHETDKWMTGMYEWEKESADANYPDIHLFKVEERWEHNSPLENCNGKWVVCSPEVAATFSAIGFLFARELHKTLDIPVGIILCAFGGTHAESWTRREIMENDSLYNKVYKSYSPERDVCKKYPHKVPSAIWNGMVNPILGFTVKGNIWYQAESNAWRADDYPPIFVNMVNDWRSLWGQKRLPFYFMQVAPFGTMPGIIREMQAQVFEKRELEDIGMATAIDCGDSLDIHPKNKVTPAHRLALWALAKEYGKNVEYCGPQFNKMKVKAGKAIIGFKNGNGLHILNSNGQKSSSGAAYIHIAGPDGLFYPANSAIKGKRLILWHPDVDVPTKVKYCTEDYCKGNIYNGDNLPAYPFRKELEQKTGSPKR